MSIQAYPLSWPKGFPRALRKMGDQFRTSLSGALGNVEKSLKAFSVESGKKIENVCVSSNVTLGVQRPADSGVAVWFSWDGLQVCIPVDRYEKVEANLQAIHHILEARRTELRHGGLAIVRAAFTGLKALPAPAAEREWWRVLGFTGPVVRADARAAYQRLRSSAHPDKGGTAEAFREVEAAWEEAQRVLA